MATDGAFRPKRERSEARLIYDELLAAADFGAIISYEMLDELLGRPFKDNRSPLYVARRWLGELRTRWIESVVNVGYRVIDANEHVRAAQERKRRASRQLDLGIKIIKATDITRLTPDELVRYDQQARVNLALYSITMQHESRLNRIEAALRGGGLLG